jgi:hypothetical protein
MLLFAPAFDALLLAVPVFSGVTPAKPIAEKCNVVKLTYDIPQIQLALEDRYYASSVETQYALTFPESFPC